MEDGSIGIASREWMGRGRASMNVLDMPLRGVSCGLSGRWQMRIGGRRGQTGGENEESKYCCVE